MKWGSHSVVLLTVYKGLIRFVLDWCGLVLVDLPEKRLIPLDRAQLASLRVMLGFMRTTPTNVILDQTVEWPLKFRFFVGGALA